MKFLCDRCKTRYSIGDDRVRGKILKIRCKNCNNVITVREGMTDAGADASQRTKQPTQSLDAPAPAGNALGAAFASAMTKPPPALEEEWYVSIDGEQAGPYNLAEAQRWVASKPFEAELHCWSEGFDDWLPVDKVSHFRGLRKKPAPAPAPPPIPRAATNAHRAATRPGGPGGAEADEPKPLFAATMASLEKATQPPLGSGNFQLPAIQPASAPSSRGTPLGGSPAMSAKTNGKSSGPIPSISPARAAAAAAAAKPIFDPADSATQVETPPFDDEKMTAPEPAASTRRADPFANKPDPFAPTTPQPARPDPFAAKPAPVRDVFAKADPFAKPPPAMDFTQPIKQEDINDDLDIGEVSRVVKLADLMPKPKGDRGAQPAAASGSALGRRSGPIGTIGKATGSATALAPRSSAGSIPPPLIGPDGQQLDPATGEPVPLAPQVAVSHRRGMIALVVGAILLLGAAGAVVFMVLGEESGGTGLGGDFRIDTTRPDDPRRTGGPTAQKPPDEPREPSNPFVPKKVRPRVPDNPPVPPPVNDARALQPDEVEAMATKNSNTTQTCWRRSQRGAEAIILGDLKRLGVTLSVDPSGTVTNVTLSDHATTSLGRCLITSIRGWKFRPSSNGITARITLVFQGV